ncbi:unnamed protein product [Allacma fusca]|uniref:GPR158/179 extracellular domain-containing protein n=1 Tax=Allacma fusca TaxID=39272 RepID=A0A8J2JNJ2_9HEXA|nr:unnamed protein product [Allacma fusca]
MIIFDDEVSKDRLIAYVFCRGTSGIDIDLRRVDIDQCPLPENSTELNIFAASDKCKNATTKCVPIKGLGFRRGSYRCECQPGYYFPNTSSTIKYFNGTVLEEEYEKKLMNEKTMYDEEGAFECLRCLEGCDTCEDDRPCVVTLNWLMRSAILILQCAIIAMLPIVGLFTWKYSDIKVVRAASPVLLRFIVLGAFLIYCTPFLRELGRRHARSRDCVTGKLKDISRAPIPVHIGSIKGPLQASILSLKPLAEFLNHY